MSYMVAFKAVGRYAPSAVSTGLALVTALATSPLHAQRPTRDWALEDRVVIGAFSRITSVAATSDRVYATSPSALLVWRPQFARWEGPFVPPEPRLLEGVTMALADPLDNSLWLAGRTGWVNFSPDLQLWTVGEAPAPIRSIAFDMASPDGLLLDTGQGWLRANRGSSAVIPAEPPSQPIRPATMSEVARTHPSLQTGGGLLVDPRLRDVRYTSAAQSFDRLGWYLGTDGAGLLYLREGSAFPERLSFGLVGDRIGALFSAPGGVWVANDLEPNVPAALTFVAADLSEFRSVYGPPATGLPFGRVRQLIGVGLELWAATDQGVARIQPQTGRTDIFDERRGLPDSRAYALAARREWIAAGTARGAARISDSAEVIRIAPDFAGPAYAVGISADTTWIGTDAGLFFTVSRSGPMLQPTALAASQRFRGPVIGIEWMGERLVALTRERLIWRGERGVWTAGPDQTAALGPLRAFVLDGDGAWLAGERGVGYARFDAPVGRILPVGDIPAPPVDLALDADHLWVGTAAGLVRFRLDALGR